MFEIYRTIEPTDTLADESSGELREFLGVMVVSIFFVNNGSQVATQSLPNCIPVIRFMKSTKTFQSGK